MMCSNGKCISIETGSLIFAILSIMLTGVGVLVIIAGLAYLNFVIVSSTNANSAEEVQMAIAASFATNFALIVLMCLILVPFAFTIVLIKGLIEKRAGLVKVYFIYSVVSKSLLLFAAVMGLVFGCYPEEHAITILIIFVFYGLILRMIYLTYKKLEVDAQYKENRLVEEKY